MRMVVIGAGTAGLAGLRELKRSGAEALALEEKA